jgi:hypothetical protein
LPTANYRLSTWDEQHKQYIQLSNAEFEELKQAKGNLLEVLFIEEQMNILVESYLEWENELLAISTRHVVQWDLSYLAILSQRDLLSRRMMALLTSCKGYIDHAAHHVSSIYGKDSHLREKFQKWRHDQFNNRLGYRLMEQLRNHVQHRGWPFHAVSRNGNRVEFDYGSRLRFSTGTLLRVSELAKDPKFTEIEKNRSILTELQQKGDQLELQLFVREYIAGLSLVHQNLRDELKHDVAEWDGAICGSIDRLHKTFPEQGGGTIFAFSAEEEVWLSKEYIEARQALERKNRAIPHLATHFVSNEVAPK